jgi:plasmid stabilization system protein ParE
MNVRVTADARLDVLQTEARLEREQSGYGTAFADLFEAAVAAIRANPRLHSPTEDGPDCVETREVFIDRFNQRVIYVVTDAEAVILTVTHAHRRPGAWAGRLAGFT